MTDARSMRSGSEILRDLDDASKSCPVCGNELERRPNENSFHWGRRKFCSRSCAAKTGGGAERMRQKWSEVPVTERFWAKVDKTGDCWVWTASTRGSGGYGQFRIGKRQVFAHRVAYELEIGPIPEGLVIDHLCRNHLCVNPAHLEPVTERENILRGEAPSAQAARSTRCQRGHLFPERDADGKRQCTVCRNQKQRERRGRKNRA